MILAGMQGISAQGAVQRAAQHAAPGRPGPRGRQRRGGLALSAALLLALAACNGESTSGTLVTASGHKGAAATVTLGDYGAACTLGQSNGGDGSSTQSDGSGTSPDPLFAYQWYLQNAGQTAFSDCPGTAGADLHLGSAYTASTGSGIIVAVVDTGLQIAHTEFTISAAASATSHNFSTGTTDPTASGSGGDHGTSVAGLIAAKKDGVGIQGVAYGAKLVGYNLICSTCSQDTASLLDSLGQTTYSAGVDVFNESFGIDSNAPLGSDSTYDAALKYGVTNLRGGKGAIYVKAAGNGFYDLTPSGGTASGCGPSYSAGLPCENANMDPDNVAPWQIVVGALNAEGVRSSYSASGSSLWVSGMGGEFGASYRTVLTAGLPIQLFKPAMVTTDVTGCSAGYSVSTFNGSSTINPFTLGWTSQPSSSSDLAAYTIWHTNNSSCNYTASFNGTSSATPVVSGVAALLLQANPSLTWRDVKYILASTAKKVDASQAGVSLALRDGTYVAEPAWTTNAAGLHFHNWYGFGLVDVSAAVSAATASGFTSNGFGTTTAAPTLSTYPSSGGFQDCACASQAIPDGSVVGASSTFTVTASGLTFVEAVQVQVSVTHPYLGDVGIELTSPSGTRSVLLNVRNGYEGHADFSNQVLLSNAFYGEPVNGAWTLKVVDGALIDRGTLTDWGLRIYGH